MAPRLGDRDGRPPVLSVVVPLFDEQATLAELHRRLDRVLGPRVDRYEIIFVDDGSRDGTPALLDALAETDPRVRPIHLSRNFGHQAAVSAGLDHARGDAVIVLDGDLQDPPEVIPQLVDLWRAGHDVVYAVRVNRKEGPLRRAGYWAFYRLLRALSDIEMPLDSGDFCLMDRKVVDVLRHLPERLRFLRGLRAFAGFRQVGLRYDRAGRAAGASKYSTRALVRLAVDGLVSFSSYPLRLVTYLGIASAGLALTLTAWVLIDAFHQRGEPARLGEHDHRRPVHGVDAARQPRDHRRIRPADLPRNERPAHLHRRPDRSGRVGADGSSRPRDQPARPPLRRGRSRAPDRPGPARPMIATWTAGDPDAGMAEEILVDLLDTIPRHPWWIARAALTLALLNQEGIRPPARVLDAGCGWGVTLAALGAPRISSDRARCLASHARTPRSPRPLPDRSRPHPTAARRGSSIRRRARPRRDRAPRR